MSRVECKGLMAGVCLSLVAVLAWPVLAAAEAPLLTLPVKVRLTTNRTSTPVGAATKKIDLVFSVYDQKDGGTKLLEERQSVTAIADIVMAQVGSTMPGGIPESVVAGRSGLWVEVAKASEPEVAIGDRVLVALKTAPGAIPAVAFSVSVDDTICFTCGGAWPNFSGSISTASPFSVTERGAGCAGAPVAATDGSPFLCSRNPQ